MMIDKNDPRLTAFVFGELDSTEQAEIQSAIDASPELMAAVDEIRATVDQVALTFQSEPDVGLREDQKEALNQTMGVGGNVETKTSDPIQSSSPAPSSTSTKSNGSWMRFVMAASLIGILATMVVVVWQPGKEWVATSGKTEVPEIAVLDSKQEAADSYREPESDSTLGRPLKEENSLADDAPGEVSSKSLSSAQPVMGGGGGGFGGGGLGGRSRGGGRSVAGLDSQNTDQNSGESAPANEGMLNGGMGFQENVPLQFESTGAIQKGRSESLEIAELSDPSNDDAPQAMVLPAAPRLVPDSNENGQGQDRSQEETLAADAEIPLRSRIRAKGDRNRDQLSLGGGGAESLVRDSRSPAESTRADKSEEESIESVEKNMGIRGFQQARKAPAGQTRAADKPSSELKKNTDSGKGKGRNRQSWRRVRAVPNTSRLMLGDKTELVMKGMQANIQVDGFRARVLLDCFYYNDQNQQLEARFKLRLPDDASLYYFAFGESVHKYSPKGKLTQTEFFESRPQDDRQFVSLRPAEIRKQRVDSWRNVKEARVVPKEKAAFAYNQTVRRRVDPALVEWSGAGVFNARVFPLMPNKLHRIVIGYDVDLQATEDGLGYEFQLPESIGECTVDLNVRKIGGTTVDVSPAQRPLVYGKGDQFQSYKFVNPNPSETIRVKLDRQEDKESNTILKSYSKAEGNYFATRIKADLPIEQVAGKSRGIFMVDTSLSSQPDKFNVWLKLLEATLENNRGSMNEFAVLFFNVENHYWKSGWTANNRENVERLMQDCQGLSLEGATDIFSALYRLNTTDWIQSANESESAAPDLFLLSDGAATWGETDTRQMQNQMALGNLGSLFAYQTGMSGTAIAKLRNLAGGSGGAVFSVSNENEVTAASTAHRARPWKLVEIRADGASDLLTAGRAEWVYPGQSLKIVGRLGDPQGPDAPAIGKVSVKLQKGTQTVTLNVDPSTEIESEMAARMFGQVAVGQLESLGDRLRDVSIAYARHFRITGQTCSLLMLDSEADYQRFDIKPEEDLFVVKSRNADKLIRSALEKDRETLNDPKTQLLSWVRRLESMPGLKFKIPTALGLVLEDIQVEPIAGQLDCGFRQRGELSDDWIQQLSAPRLDYSMVSREAKRRSESSADDAIKVLSNLVEQNPGDLVLARDVAFSALEYGKPEQAYHLLRRIAQARPYEPSVYAAIGQCLAQMDRADMAVLFYEIALGAKFNNRDQEYRRIVGTHYVHLLRKVVNGGLDSSIDVFAQARLESLTKEMELTSKDLVITMMWNTDQTDVDLHVIEPTGEECYYQNRKTRIGGIMTRDITDGFGPEMYTLTKAPRGEYDVKIKYYAGNQNRTGMRSKVYLTIYRNFGTDAETVSRRTVEAKRVGEKESVTKVTIGK